MPTSTPLVGAPLATPRASSMAELLLVFIFLLPAMNFVLGISVNQKNLHRGDAETRRVYFGYINFSDSLRLRGEIFSQTSSPASANSFLNSPAMARSCFMSSAKVSGSSACGPSH